MKTKKILVKGTICANGLHMFIGGTNPAIFQGEFEVKYSKDFVEHVYVNLQRGAVLETKIHGLSLTITNFNRKEGVMMCFGYLPSVSPAFFRKLQREGWVLDKEAAAKYAYPSDEIEKDLKAEIKKYQDDARQTEQLIINANASFKRFSKWMKKQGRYFST